MPNNKKENGYIRGIAYTSQGYMLPCCWLDNPSVRDELEKLGFYDETLKVENNETIDNIIYSDAWSNFIYIINHDPNKAPNKCKRMCGY